MLVRFFTLLLILSIPDSNAQITYKMKVKNFSSEAVNSYPQQLLNKEHQDTVTLFTVEVMKAYDDNQKRMIAEQDCFSPAFQYPEKIAWYLESTPLIHKENPVIAHIVDTLFGAEQKTLKLIEAGLKFTSRYITFDNVLAMEISKGNCKTLPVENIIENRKGTCSEYTNLFIALMRKKGIPSRFIAGFIYMPDNNFQGCHAWAECYIKDYGWLAVDPQSGKLWIPPTAIKLFAGKDFNNCNLNSFMDLVPLSISIINKEK